MAYLERKVGGGAGAWRARREGFLESSRIGPIMLAAIDSADDS